jgi:hypothetical protein
MKRLAIVLIILCSCEGITEFIPPDFEEKLYVIAIINDYKVQNKIVIEKSYQNEYPSEEKENLENLSVIIRSDNTIMFEYFNPQSENRKDTIYISDDLDFIPNEKYTLNISEKNTESITSEVIVPYYPFDFDVSVEGFVQTFLPPPLECHNPVKSIILKISFKAEKDFYYFLDFEHSSTWLNVAISYQMNYEILESNTPFLRTNIPAVRSLGFNSCWSELPIIPYDNYQACFIDGNAIPDNYCTLRLKIDINNSYFNYNEPIKITLNSAPKELYAFEKSYSTYLETLFDPFSEPVFINGNIKGGCGIFAICSSKQHSFLLPID